MAECRFLDGTIVSDYGTPYIVVEVNSSHGGDMEIAKEMIDKAVEMGGDCVKFQSWTADSLYCKSYYEKNPIAKRFVKKFSLSPAQLKELSIYCNGKGIAFSSTPYSEEEVDFLVEQCQVPFVKIASMEVNNPKFLHYIGSKHVPVVLSTGMSTMEEVTEAVEVLKKSGVTQMVILHCVSIYPTILTSVNLRNIIGLRDRFIDFPVGFSDHTEGDAAAVASVALGACMLEKHFTLDKNKVGMDNGMATEPKEFAALVNKCKNIQIALGSTQRELLPLEFEQRRKMRRSLVAIRDIHVGEIIEEGDLCVKRPGDGFSPKDLSKVVGKKVKKDILADTIILPDQLM